MAEPFIGEIRVFPFNFAPVGWAQCNGQLLPVRGNQALFSVISNLYGGDGKTTFALPNLQGRTPIAPDERVSIKPGSIGGEESHILKIDEMPSHAHDLRGASRGTSIASANNVWASSPTVVAYTDQANNTMSSKAIAAAGSNYAHLNMQPFVALNFCIAMQGNYPPRP